jgi:transposase
MENYQLPAEAKTQVKANGIRYVFFNYPYWKKATEASKAMGAHRRLYIGHLGPNNEFIPNEYYLCRIHKGYPDKPSTYQSKEQRDEDILYYRANKLGVELINRNSSINQTNDLYYGAVYLLEQIGIITGLESDLSQCFPDNYKQILSLVYYMVLEDHSPFYRFDRWNHDHKHPCQYSLSSQRISDILLNGITYEQKMIFFKLQASRRIENEFLAYDTTSISSYSKLIKSVRYGRNKDKEKLPQVNIAMVLGEKSMLPVYYRLLPGNINNVKTISILIQDLDILGVKQYSFVLDRGFYSSENINLLFKAKYDFIISMRKNLTILRDIVEKARQILTDSKINSEYFDDISDTYILSDKKSWLYQDINDEGLIVSEQHREIFIHACYNSKRAEDEKQDFFKLINETKRNLETDNPLNKEQTSIIGKFIEVNKDHTGKTLEVKVIRDKVNKKSSEFGHFAILTNKNLPSNHIVRIYKQKDLIEKAFDNLKDRFEFNRTDVYSDTALNNKLFLSFLGLIYISYIDKQMKENDMYKNISITKLFDNLDVIKIFTRNNKQIFSEITEKQRNLYIKLGVSPPA